MLVNIEKVDAANPVAVQEDDELLIVLNSAGGGDDPWIADLRKQALPNLFRRQFYSEYHTGFQGEGGKKPFLILDWKKSGANSLERRYVAGRLGRHVNTQFACKKLAIYLSANAGTEQLAIVEDIHMRQTSSRFEKSNYDRVRILAADQKRLEAVDPHRKVRFEHKVEFRRWVNMNPDEMTSIRIGEELKNFSQKHSLDFESMDEKELAKKGLNLLVAVGQASDLSPSRLHLVSSNVKKGDKPLLLIGKGVTFDTGGINVKPHESHVNCMKNDMGGAGLMVNLFKALVEAGYKGPLALAIPCCENLVAQKSMKPGAIVKSYKGQEVLIEHTDAEGRLILADAIAYAQEKWDPSQTIVAATLTTAALRQFSNYFTPVHFSDEVFQTKLTAGGNAWGEKFTYWDEFLPFLQGNKSIAADLTNMGRLSAASAGSGGSSVAGHFLKEFSNGSPFIHFDIFASTWNWSGDYPGAHYGATGAPFNSLFQALMEG